MKLSDLEKIVRKGESERLEFKHSTGQRSEAAKTVCAMLNGAGGFLFFGIDDSGKLYGQQVTAKTLEDVAAELRRIEPPAFPDIEPVELDNGATVIALRIPGGGGLYTIDGRAFLRVGSTTRLMPKPEYERRLIQRLHAVQRWENEFAMGVTLDDLDIEEIHRTCEDAVRLGRLSAATRRDPEAILRGLELIRDGSLLNAAVVLYGNSERLRPLYPQLSIRLGRFRGLDRLAEFSDNRFYWGHAFELMRRAESFLQDHIPIPGRVVSGKRQREDRPWVAPRAMREALANALCHRDYAMAGGSVAIAMYDDRIEITNPGGPSIWNHPRKSVSTP